MNPYRMEVILKDMTGRGAHVDDASGPVNTFTITLDPGEGAVDVAAAIKRINEVKQSHTTFTVRILAFTQIEICGKVDRYKALYPGCGTVPGVSAGMRITGAGLTIMPDLAALCERFPMAGASGDAGQYPKTSARIQAAESGLDIAADAEGRHMISPYASKEMQTGSYPGPGSQAVCTDAGIDVSAQAAGDRFQSRPSGTVPGLSSGLGTGRTGAGISPILKAMGERFPVAGGSGMAGRYPGTSKGLVDVEDAVEAVVSAYANIYHGRPSGTVPDISEGMEGAGNGVDPQVDTECYQVRYRFCGDDFEF